MAGRRQAAAVRIRRRSVLATMRISIIGHTGCGKSTLARKIAERFSVPHIHIDRFWFEAGGNRLAPGEGEARDVVRAYVAEHVREAVRAPSWVSDGFYPHTQAEIADAADTIVYLEIPLWRRLTNHFERILRRAERHAEVSIWDDIAYFPDMVRRHFRTKPKLERFLTEREGSVLVLRSRREAQQFLDSLASSPAVVQSPHK